ncbi:MAG: permease [bacterium]|nr:permease [bacterium]
MENGQYEPAVAGTKRAGLSQADWDAKVRGFFISVIFMLAVAGLLLALLIPVLRLSGGMEAFPTFQVVFISIVLEAVPFILLGSLISGLIHVLVPEDTLKRFIPTGRLPAVMAGAFLGLLFPICECGVIPVARGLMRKGVPFHAAVAFILAAPVVNPVVILSTAVAFNYDFKVVAARVGLVLLIAVSIGLLMAFLPIGKSVMRQDDELPEGCSCCSGTSSSTLVGKAAGVIEHATKEFFDVGKFLILGSFLAAFIQTFISRPQLLAVAKGPVLSVLSMNTLAVLTCLCSEVDAFVARSFSISFSMGAVISFMVIGPMLDIKSAMMLLGTFKRRPAILLISLIILLTTIAGILLNLTY